MFVDVSGGGKNSSTGVFFLHNFCFSAIERTSNEWFFEGREFFSNKHIQIGVLCELDGVTKDTLPWETPAARNVIYPTTKSHLLHTSHLADASYIHNELKIYNKSPHKRISENFLFINYS